ncbi:methylated-DNA--[protein]-cysteine S-methyltransferase [Lacinutrix gracilariae]|uniref:Methylated-DNA--protein-cysteine methyltransferase n=1 Tax=Lacinutrix gracilariae TaxID=1747198 RepID=A0ABW5K359_9FLAO
MQTCNIKTPLGLTKITGNQDGVASITVLNPTNLSNKEPNNGSLQSEQETTITENIPETLQECVTQLHEYFKGSRKQFSLKLNPKGTNFQKRVWNALQTIPYGKTTSYLQLSKQLGDVKAIRAVANANGKNPLWIIIPCHRVIGSDGSLTGYAGGLHRKQWLLEHESPYTQQSLF